MTPKVRINLWSGPRNVSTALMYSFAQRSDTCVVDEPLYAHYLRVSGADHPGRDEVLAAQDVDGDAVVRHVVLGPSARPVLFLKQMAHHLVDLDEGFLARTTNVLLTRDPRGMLPSLARALGTVQLRDTGLPAQAALLQTLTDLGQDPPVIVARDLLLDPEGVLRALCERVGLAFESAMLHWSAGARPEDGVWAPHWYANVHRSTEFGPPRDLERALPKSVAGLLPECSRLFHELAARRVVSSGGNRA